MLLAKSGALASAFVFFFFQAEDGIRDLTVTGVQTCALPISSRAERHTFPTHLAAPAHAFVGIDDGRAPGRFLPWTGHHKKSGHGARKPGDHHAQPLRPRRSEEHTSEPVTVKSRMPSSA